MVSNISGFPELLPREQIAFNRIVGIIKDRFELYGFVPIDTPAVEKAATLLAKGNDSEIYGIYRLAGAAEANKKDLALRFDLTVPLARYVAQHYGSLTFPYRRYHIAPVWRGERPQAGRHRQFYQCDVDIIGDGELDKLHDAEILSVVYETLKAIGLDNFVIKVNNCSILTCLIQSFGILGEAVPAIMRVIDKADKISADMLRQELVAKGLAPDNVELLIELTNRTRSNQDWFTYLNRLSELSELQAGVRELAQLLQDAQSFGIPEQYLQIDPSLARGLSYYTGNIYEVKSLDFPELGSICGGGRYANLAGEFTNKNLPGVGVSFGVSRLLPRLMNEGRVAIDSETTAQVLVATQNRKLMPAYIAIAQALRQSGIATELYMPEKPLEAQMKYANRKGFEFVVIADQEELAANKLIVRRMSESTQMVVDREEIVAMLKNRGEATTGP